MEAPELPEPLAPLQNPSSVPAQMIMELAARIMPAKDILSRYEVDPVMFKTHISKDPQFLAAFKEARAFWGSDSNAKERIQVKAAVMLEDSLLELYSMFHDAQKNPTARLDALSKMMKLAKMDAGEAKADVGVAAGRSVHVNIHMGSTVVEREISAITIEGEIDE